MDALSNKIKITYNSANVIALTLALVFYFNMMWQLGIHWSVIALSSSLICVIISLFDYYKRSIYTYIILFCVAIFALTFFIIKKINVMSYLTNIIHWFVQYQSTNVDYRFKYAFVCVFVAMVFISLISHMINKNSILRYLASLALIVILIYCSINKIEINKIILSIILIYTMECLVEICNKIYNKNNEANSSIANIYMLPICIIIGLLAVCLPSKEEPIKWTKVIQLYNNIVTSAEDLSYYFSNIDGNLLGEYGLNFAGYSEGDGKLLGGTINDSNRIILKVSPGSKTNGSTYLIGSIRDKYNSNSWEKTEIDYGTLQEPTVDFYEMLYGMYQQEVTPNETEVLFNSIKVYINYNKIKTKSIFYPLKTYKLEPSLSDFTYDSSTPSLLASKSLKKDFSYQLDYYEVNYASQTLQDYLRRISKVGQKDLENKKFNHQDCNAYINDRLELYYIDNTLLNDDFAEVLNKRYDKVATHYTQLPEGLPKRVYDLAQKITQPYDNDYDKLKAIEAYFSAFTYTTSPTKTKAGEDFVDYFLFNQKEGYCTYFATSMAVLARCVGIPTRYVEGVLVDYSNKDGGFYLVSGNSAHAWVEAYIKGFGWVPFEPTPNMYNNRYSVWAPKYIASDTVTTIEPEPELLVEDNKPVEVPVEDYAGEDHQRSIFILKFCVGSFIIVFMIMVSVIAIFYYNRRRKYKRASNSLKARYLVRDILDYLKMDGKGIMLAETLTDYSVRLGKLYDFEEVTLEKVLSIYVLLRYADKDIEQKELETIESYRNQLKQRMLEKFGWIWIVKSRWLS